MLDKPVMRIGYVVKMFPRLSETFVLNEMIELERQGAEITVFSIKKPNEGRFHPQVSNLKARVYYLEDLDSKKYPVWLSRDWKSLGDSVERVWPILKEALAEGNNTRVEQIWWAAWLAARIHELGINRLHAHFASLPSTIADLAGRIAGVPYSFTAHAKDIYVYDMQQHQLEEKLQTAQFVVTVTEYNRRYLIDQGGSGDKVKLLYNGINLDRFSYAPPEAREDNLVLAVGRLVPKKGFDDLLLAFRTLLSDGVSFRCKIVGDGPEREALESLKSELGLNGLVELTGPRNSDEVNAMLKQATLFALPCKAAEDGNIDALPTVLLESLAVGLPSVSTNFSGIPEIIDNGKEGLLVQDGDSVALAGAIKELLSNPARRAEFSRSGRMKAEQRFNIRNNVGTLLELFCNNGTVDAELTASNADNVTGKVSNG